MAHLAGSSINPQRLTTIQADNAHLMRRLAAAQSSTTKAATGQAAPHVKLASAYERRARQRAAEIERGNQLLLRKLQAAKTTVPKGAATLGR